MRVFATLARVVLFVLVAHSGHSCKKADSNSTEPLQQPCSAPEYAFASAFWDGETIWWGDVTRLQQNPARHGDALKIEKALPVGAVPLKRVATAGTAQNPGIKAPVRQERTLR